MPQRVRIFTVAEANALLPALRDTLARQASYVRAIDEVVAVWREKLGGATPDLRPCADDPDELAQVKVDLRALITAFREAWTEIESTGAVLKDVRQGLIDFYGQRHDKLVWLCWRIDEPAISHWHPLGQGFGQRQALDASEFAPSLN